MNADFFHGPKLTLIVKPTSQCNGNCVYCCSQKPNGPGWKMSDKTLALLFERLQEYCTQSSIARVEFIWHGGEPLLMKPPFYEKVAEYAASLSSGVSVTHGIQTNLLLFDEEFVSVFRKLGMKLSTSVDPMKGIRMADSVDYLDLWIEKLQDALRCGFHVGVICVIHKKHLPCLSEVLQYFENLHSFTDGRIVPRFNILYRSGGALDNAIYNDLGLTPEECGDVFVRLWNWWDAGGRLLSHAPPMSEWAHMFEQTDGGKSCSHSDNCATGWLAVDGDGFVYNCGRHMDSGPPFGNIHTAALAEIVSHPERIRMYKRADLLKKGECRGCAIWDKCYGGCPDDAFLYSGDRLRKSHWCESYRLFHEKVFMKNE